MERVVYCIACSVFTNSKGVIKITVREDVSEGVLVGLM